MGNVTSEYYKWILKIISLVEIYYIRNVQLEK
jgi:hypothetical protein